MLPTIGNFRVIARDRSENNVLFRSSAIDKVDARDAALLLNDLNIQSVVDLRTEKESVLKSNEHLKSHFSLFAVSINQKTPTLEFQLKTITDDNGPRKVYCMSLFQREVAFAYLRMLPFFRMVFMISLALIDKLFKTEFFKRRFTPIVGEFGIRVMYRNITLHSRPEICAVLKIINKVSQWPLVVMCSVGKDRTGMISALVQYLQGCSKEKIQEEFCFSEIILRKDSDIFGVVFKSYKFDEEEFIQSPGGLILAFFEDIENQSGSVENWLNDGGFTFSEQEELRGKLENFS